MHAPVEVQRQVALTLYYLSDEGRLRKTITSKCVHNSVKFHEAFTFPQCLGAIDCTHIDIKQPRINPTKNLPYTTMQKATTGGL